MMKPAAYTSHPLWQALDTLRANWERVTPPADPEARFKLETLAAFIAYLDQYREDDGLLALEQHMNQMSQFVSGMGQQLGNLAGESPNWGHLDNAVNAIPQAMQYLGQNLPAPSADSATTATKRASTMYRKALDAEAAQFRIEIDTLRTHLSESEQKRQEQEAAFAEQLAALGTAAQERDEQIAAQAAQLVKQIEAQRASFDAATTERASQFADEAKQRAAEAQVQREQIEAEADEVSQTLSNEAEALLQQLREHEATSETLVETTARNAIAGDYGAWAQKQAKAAIGWTIAAVVLGVLTAVGLVVVLWTAGDDTTQFAISKTTIGLVGLIVAGYCARQGAEHRREERIAKRLHLDLAALEPFLKQVENADELRAEVARRVFVPQVVDDDTHIPKFGFRRGWTVQEIGELVNLFGKRT